MSFGESGSSSTGGYSSKNTREIDDMLLDEFKKNRQSFNEPSLKYQGVPDLTKGVFGFKPTDFSGKGNYTPGTYDPSTFKTPELKPVELNPNQYKSMSDISTRGAKNLASSQHQGTIDSAAYRGIKGPVADYMAAQGDRQAASDMAATGKGLAADYMGKQFDESSGVNRLRAQLEQEGQKLGEQSKQFGATFGEGSRQFGSGLGLDYSKLGEQSKQFGAGLASDKAKLGVTEQDLAQKNKLMRLGALTDYFKGGMEKPSSSSSSSSFGL